MLWVTQTYNAVLHLLLEHKPPKVYSTLTCACRTLLLDNQVPRAQSRQRRKFLFCIDLHASAGPKWLIKPIKLLARPWNNQLDFFKGITQVILLACSFSLWEGGFFFFFWGTQATWPVELRYNLVLAFYSRSGVSTDLIISCWSTKKGTSLWNRQRPNLQRVSEVNFPVSFTGLLQLIQ